jgi:hypothetical protein
VAASASVMSQKFIEEQEQVLRLILPPNHPSDEDLSPGTPVRAKIRSGWRLICDANFRLTTPRHFSDICWVAKWRAMWIFLIRNSVSSSRVGNTGDRLEEKSTRQWWLRSIPIREMR